MPIRKVQVIKKSAPMPEFSRTFMQTLRNESNDTEKHEKFIKTQYHLNSLERTFLFANAVCHRRSIKSFDQFQFAEASFSAGNSHGASK